MKPRKSSRAAGAEAVAGEAAEPLLLQEAQDKLRRSEAAQRVLEEQLAAETRRLRESQAVANVGSWETDLRTLVVTWTDATYRIFEVSPEQGQLTHQRFLELVHPDDRNMVGAAFADSAGRPGVCAVEHRISLPDGRIKLVEER